MKTENSSSFRLLAAVIFLGVVSVALGAQSAEEGSDVVDATAFLSPAAKLTIYGLLFLVLCAVSWKVPDAPLLLFIFSMGIAQFSGLRVGLGALQCALVCLRSGKPWAVVPSWPLSVFLICIVASATWALDPQETLFGESSSIYVMILQLPITLAARGLLQTGQTTVRRLLWALTLGSVPGCVLTIQNARAGIQFIEEGSGYYMGFIRPDIFSPMLVLCGAFLLWILTAPGVRKAFRVIAGCLLPLICISLFLAGVRSGWIGFSAAVLVLVLSLRSKVALVGFAVMAVLVAGLFFGAASRLHLEEQFGSRMSSDSMRTGDLRVEYWEVAAGGFLKRPVLGIGWGGFPAYAADNTVGRQAATHNIYVRVACELGLVGFGLFGIWIAAAYFRSRRHPDGGLIGLLMVGLFAQGMLLDHFVCSYFWLFLGICDGVRGKETALEPSRLRPWKPVYSGTADQPAATL